MEFNKIEVVEVEEDRQRSRSGSCVNWAICSLPWSAAAAATSIIG